MRIPVVVGQVPITWRPDRNCAVIGAFLAGQTSPGDLVVLPEAVISGYDDELSGLDDLDPRELSEAADAVSELVAAHDVHLLCGALALEDGTWRNTAIYFSPEGRRWTYRKVNLASSERGRLVAGSTLPVLSAAIGRTTVRIGVQLCREIRFPEQWHVLARSGAQMLAYLTYAANPREPAGVWRSHLISRAAETQRYVLAANVAHPDQHCPSMIVSPRGDVLAEAGTTEPTALRHELELGDVSDWYVSQQRSDVVEIGYLGESDRG
ncbi:MAG TPA: carbon-nitrogen hydrolase family protein [Jatrophihabitans sp.]|nr:carbon-nitrogen hydrolase family protein [Jatrophihabitans sp.]